VKFGCQSSLDPSARCSMSEGQFIQLSIGAATHVGQIPLQRILLGPYSGEHSEKQ
jgi:hypothetical protein